MKHSAKHGAICVCWITSHSGQDMKKAHTSFPFRECDVDSYPLRRALAGTHRKQCLMLSLSVARNELPPK